MSKRPNPEDVDSIRLRSRQQYLEKRQELKLAELRRQVQEEAEEERTNPHLSTKELKEFTRNRETLKLAEARLAVDDHYDGYALPDANLSDKTELLKRRHKEPDFVSEVDAWEAHQTVKAKAQVKQAERTQEEDYEYVFDPAQELKWVTDGAALDLDPKKRMLQDQLDAAEKKAKTIQETRENLPVYQRRDEIVKAVQDNPVLIFVGETGSGKTTQIPQFLAESGYAAKGVVGVTQPRRVAAMSVAARVAEEFGTRLGKKVGYSIRFEDKTSPETQIKFLTDGMLLREMLTDPMLSKYSVIMLDEAHERTTNTDILMSLLKDLVRLRGEEGFRLVIASATLDSERFSAYFDNAPVFFSPGRQFVVDRYWVPTPEADYVKASITTILQVHLSQGPGDILVFYTGSEEIEMAKEYLEETMKKLGSRAPELIVRCLYASLDQSLQQLVFEDTPPGARKVVLATNIAETSITVDGVRFVIDSGLVKQNHYDSRTGMESLVVTPIARSAASQRAGRAGRTGRGVALALYTKWSYYNELEENTIPEILRVDLSSTILMLKAMGINDLMNFDFMDPPPAETLAKSLELLYALGAITSDGSISRLGRRMSELPLSPMLSKAILAAEKYGCVEEVITIVAMLQESNSLFIRPKDKLIHAQSAHARFADKDGGDHLTYLKIYNEWEEAEYSIQWCKENFLQARTLSRARDVREQLSNMLARVEITPSSNPTDHVGIRRAVVSGFFMNSARLAKDGKSYNTIKHGLSAFIHPSSVLKDSRNRWIIYSELVMTSKEFLRGVLPIESSWLTDAAPHFYKPEDLEKLGVEKKVSKGQGKVGVDR